MILFLKKIKTNNTKSQLYSIKNLAVLCVSNIIEFIILFDIL